MLEKLDSPHYAIIPAGEYESNTRSASHADTQKTPASPGAVPVESATPVTKGAKQKRATKLEPEAAPVASVPPAPSQGAVVRFGNLPEMRGLF